MNKINYKIVKNIQIQINKNQKFKNRIKLKK